MRSDSKNNSKSRLALFIAYHYGPIRSAGVTRTAAFIRYLSELGYSCQVLTTSAFGGDENVLRAWEPIAIYRWLFNRRVRSGFVDSGIRTRRGFLSCLIRFFFVPDIQVSWMPTALWCGWRYMQKNNCDIIYSTSPPASGHLESFCILQL